jgi:hypothetical protein
MLDYMRRNAQSVVIVFILGILILAFVIEFGPQSRGCRGDPQQQQRSARTVLGVLGYDVTDLELELWRRHLYGQIGLDRFGRPVPCFMAARTSDLDPQLLALAGGLDRAPLGEASDADHFRNAFLVREALLRVADRHGVVVDDDEVKSMLAHKRIPIFDHGYWVDPEGGVHFCGGELPLEVGIGRDGRFDGQSLRVQLQQQYQMDVDDFYAFLRRNLVALKMQQILASGVGASPGETAGAARAAAEKVSLLTWTVGPDVSTDASLGAIQTRFDALRAEIAPSEVEVWSASAENAARIDARVRDLPPVPPGEEEGKRRGEIARSLIVLDRWAGETRSVARWAQGVLARPGPPPVEPPPAPEGLLVRAREERVPVLAPPEQTPSILVGEGGAGDIVRRLLALTEEFPVLADGVEQEAVLAGVTDPTGTRYALHQVVLVRRIAPWNPAESAVEGDAEASVARDLSVRRARLLDAWYETALFEARASDRLFDERLYGYLQEVDAKPAAE